MTSFSRGMEKVNVEDNTLSVGGEGDKRQWSTLDPRSASCLRLMQKPAADLFVKNFRARLVKVFIERGSGEEIDEVLVDLLGWSACYPQYGTAAASLRVRNQG